MSARRTPATDHFARLEAIALALPDARLVVIEAWDGEPTFRVKDKNFVFAAQDGKGFSVKLGKEEAAAVVGSDPRCTPTGYGLGKHGWVSVRLEDDASAVDWTEVAEWVETSYVNVAPKRLARLVLERDGDGTS
jgi:predicted DNA-binding protein (MmcQ/YjbR family)